MLKTEIFFVVILVIGFLACRFGAQEKLKPKEPGGGVFALADDIINVTLISLGAGAYSWASYHFAILAGRAWPLQGRPIATTFLVIMTELLFGACALYLGCKDLRSCKHLSDDDADAWPVHTDWSTYGGGP